MCSESVRPGVLLLCYKYISRQVHTLPTLVYGHKQELVGHIHALTLVELEDLLAAYEIPQQYPYLFLSIWSKEAFGALMGRYTHLKRKNT